MSVCELPGFPVRALANPLRGLAADAAHVASAIERTPGPVLAVGHSYGGAVITNAAARADDVVGLVHVAAFAPDEGETLTHIEGDSKDSVLGTALLPLRFYPFIDCSTGGSIDGMVRAAEANLAAVGDSTIVIPGHGPPASNKAELERYRDMLVAVRERVAALKRQGRSLDETVAQRPTAEFDAEWGRFAVTPALFTKLVYAGV